MTRKPLVPAAAYYRMSKERQETSIPAQREAVRKFADDHGYRIVAEYADEGISGDRTDKRLQFQRMIQDSTKRIFQVVLSWSQDRIGRFDPLEAGYWLKPLRDAGCGIVTIAEGEIDLNEFAGRLQYVVNQEGKYSFLRDLARNSLRGNIRRAKTGKWVGGTPPYGYVVGEDEHLELGDPQQVETVRRIFALRLEGWGYRTTAKKLNAEGIASPSGGPWSHDAVRLIVERETYCGVVKLGGRRQGKYFTTSGDEMSPVIRGKREAADPLRVENAHPPIIARETFDRVQAMRHKHPKPHARFESEGAPLAGLLYCGRCGSVMYSQSLQRKAGQKFPNYICSTYQKGHGCGYCSVPQAGILVAVSSVLRKSLLLETPKRLEAAIAEALKRREGMSAETPDRRATERKIDTLNRRIETAVERLTIVSDSVLPMLQSQITEIQRQRDGLQGLLEPKERPAAKIDPKEVADKAWELDKILREASPAKVRATLGRVIDRVRLDFVKGKKTGRGQRFEFTKGTITLRSSEPWGSPATGR